MAYFKVNHPQVMPVSLTRSAHPITSDLALWVVIRNSCSQLRFSAYADFIDAVMCVGTMKATSNSAANPPVPPPLGPNQTVTDYEAYVNDPQGPRFDAQGDATYPLLSMSGSDRYALLKAATEVFVMANCGVVLDQVQIQAIVQRVSKDPEMTGGGIDFGQITQGLWNSYQRQYALPNNTTTPILPYYGLILDKLKDINVDNRNLRTLTSSCNNILRTKLNRPCFLELIWSYWHEEGMLVQTINSILLRFQNVRSSDRDPLANMEIDPLRSLNNLLWGLIQDEQNRLTVHRRAYEYNHQYGIGLVGKAIPNFRPADARSKFIEAFHNLLYLCSVFYKEDDDTTVVADGFPVLNAIKEVHMILTEGSHNQYGDLPSTARQEMLVQEWILARPEMREFLPTRVMVALEEPWMDRVDAMKKIQGWTETSVYHFRDLGFFGEQLLLSVRFGAWSAAFSADQGANWARFWRTQVQGYMHGYRAVTGVDLTADPTTVEQSKVRFLPPSVHLQRRLAQQANKALSGLNSRALAQLVGSNLPNK